MTKWNGWTEGLRFFGKIDCACQVCAYALQKSRKFALCPKDLGKAGRCEHETEALYLAKSYLKATRDTATSCHSWANKAMELEADGNYAAAIGHLQVCVQAEGEFVEGAPYYSPLLNKTKANEKLSKLGVTEVGKGNWCMLTDSNCQSLCIDGWDDSWNLVIKGGSGELCVDYLSNKEMSRIAVAMLGIVSLSDADVVEEAIHDSGLI